MAGVFFFSLLPGLPRLAGDLVVLGPTFYSGLKHAFVKHLRRPLVVLKYRVGTSLSVHVY